MTSFQIISPEELDQEFSPEEIEDAEVIEPEHLDNVNSPFTFLLSNMLTGGGRSRSEKVASESRLDKSLCRHQIIIETGFIGPNPEDRINKNRTTE